MVKSDESPPPYRAPRVGMLAWAFVIVGAAMYLLSRGQHPAVNPLGPVIHEESSRYSHIRVREQGSLRTLIFVRDDGSEVIESKMDIARPHELQLPYSRAMFASHLYLDKPPQRVLIVGLGAGSMVRFLEHHRERAKTLVIEAVDIDPSVVAIAEKFFATRSNQHVKVITVDAFDYLRDAKPNRYDVIYMDAFLKPAADTDATGVPQRLKTIEFFRSLQTKLTKHGLVVFNINIHKKIQDDLDTLTAAFAQVELFDCASNNLIAVGLQAKSTIKKSALRTRSKKLDKQYGIEMFGEVVGNRREP